MFLIASSGRAGTYALSAGLNQYSDHSVLHEPAPQLLLESYSKHQGLPYRTDTLLERLHYFQERSAGKYGESFRAVALLPDIYEAVPTARFLILVRHPLEYVVSAHSKKVFRKSGSVWDRTRIVPEEVQSEFARLPLAHKIAWHWIAVNRHLLSFVESQPDSCSVLISDRLESKLPVIERCLGLRVLDRSALRTFLATRPNSTLSSDQPEGYSPEHILSICSTEWERARRLHT